MFCKWHNSFSHAINNCVQVRDVIQDLIVEGKILVNKPTIMRVDNEPFPAHMIGINWPERRNKRKIVVDVGEEGARKVTIAAHEKLKATITAGIVMCSRCKRECELEIPAIGTKIDEQLVQTGREIERHFSKMATQSYRPFSLKEGQNKSYEKFRKIDKQTANENFRQRPIESTKLEERDKWRTRLKQPESRVFPTYPHEAAGCSRPSTTSNSTNVRPSGPIKLAMVQDGKWYLVGKDGKPGRELTNTQARRIKRQYGKAIREMENQIVQLSPQRSHQYTRCESQNRGRSTVGMLRPKCAPEFAPRSEKTKLRPFLESRKATEEMRHELSHKLGQVS
ncbi:unnamed protein product [Prunus brigantina]